MRSTFRSIAKFILSYLPILACFLFLFDMSSLSARAADEVPLPVTNFEFKVDGQDWTPNAAINQELGKLRSRSFSNDLIKLLSTEANLSNIVVSEKEGPQSKTLLVEASRLTRVGEVGFRGLLPSQIQQLRMSLRVKVGIPWVPDESERDRENIKAKLNDRGYLSAVVGAAEVSTGVSGELRVIYPVELNAPCRISEVRTEPDISFFDYFTTPLELGSLCDRVAINEILERQRSSLLAEGFLNAELSMVQLSVSEDQLTASVTLKYMRGPRTRLELINRQTGVVSDVFSEYRDSVSAFDVLTFSDDEIKSLVRRIFIKRGYATAQITGPSRLTDVNGDSVLRFFLQAGPLVTISTVDFAGDLPKERQDVFEALGLSPGVFSGAVPYVEEDLTRYRDRLLELFYEEGYTEAQVAEPVATYTSDGRSVRLQFQAKSGVRSVLRDVSILGRPFDFSLTKNFEERILQPGQPINSGRIRDLEGDVRLELMKSGYAYATAEVATKKLEPIGNIQPVRVIVDLDPGPLVRIGRIFADGDLFGKRERIIEESGLVRGEVFSPDALEAARMRLLKHDLFDSVLIEPLTIESVEKREHSLDLIIRVQAKRSYTLGLSPSFGTRNGYRFSVDYAKNNLTRDGLRFTSVVSFSQEKLQRSVLTNQRILGRKLTLGLTEPMLKLGNTVTPLDWNLLSGFEVSAQSLTDRYFETVETGFFWRPYFFEKTWSIQAKVAHEWSKAIGTSLQTLDALDKPTVKIHEIVFGLSLDTRVNPEWPTSGGTFDLSSNHARFGLDSDVRFDRYSADFAYFFPIWGRVSGAVSSGGLKVTDVVNARSEALTAPGSRRATLAGRSFVRGFPEASSSLTPGPLVWLNLIPPADNPKLTCVPTLRSIGATNVLYAKSELRFRSPLLGDSLGFAGFVDSGAAFFTTSELAALQARLGGGEGILDAGGVDSCALSSAQVLSDSAIDFNDLSFLRQYFKNSYVSAGLSARYIISTFASLNFDIGFPMQEPYQKEKCIAASEVAQSGQAPKCVVRRSTSNLFGVLPLPGAYHVGIGANF